MLKVISVLRIEIVFSMKLTPVRGERKKKGEDEGRKIVISYKHLQVEKLDHQISSEYTTFRISRCAEARLSVPNWKVVELSPSFKAVAVGICLATVQRSRFPDEQSFLI